MKKKEAGRPTKYKDEYAKQAEKILAIGATIEELAEILNVHKSTIYEWSYHHEAFSDALKTGREKADRWIVESLYSRAKGYQHEEDKIFVSDGKTIKVPTVKHYPPDPTSMIFWLKNRQPDKWRDKPNEDNPEDEKAPVKIEVSIRDNKS